MFILWLVILWFVILWLVILWFVILWLVVLWFVILRDYIILKLKSFFIFTLIIKRTWIGGFL